MNRPFEVEDDVVYAQLELPNNPRGPPIPSIANRYAPVAKKTPVCTQGRQAMHIGLGVYLGF